jgi:hypothetical protein
MKFRLGVLVGLASGYVLGAKAGRERYEQIADAWAAFRRSEGAQLLGRQVGTAAGRAGDTLSTRAAERITHLIASAADEPQAPPGRYSR